MFAEIFRFELSYRLRRPATWIYFAIMFLLAFGATAWDQITIGGGTGQVKENAPVVLAYMMTILTAIPGFFFSSAIMGVPVLRDFEHRTGSMFYTTPMRKGTYLWGRFAGSLLVLLLVFSGMLLGLMLGLAMPWLDDDKLLPYRVWPFIQPFLVWVVPNAFVSGALFFMGGTLSRRLLWVFVQGIFLLAFYLITSDLSSELDNRAVSILLDPMGIGATQTFTQYWTVAERNSLLIPLAGSILGNRLLWLVVGIGALALTYLRFSYQLAGTGSRKRRKAQAEVSEGPRPDFRLAPAVLHQGLATDLRRVLSLVRIYIAEVAQSVPFLAIVIVGIVMLIINSQQFSTLYGTDTYPTTYQMLELLSEFNLFFIILIVFYAGELVWRERDLQMHQIFDTLPMPDFVGLVAKFLGMIAVFVVLLLVLIATGVLIQATKGYFHFELGIYFGTLFTDTLLFLVLYTLLAFFVQVLANQKFLGHALIVLFFLVTGVIFGEIGLEHRMFRFGAIDLGTYSDMNVYGHYVSPFSWFSVYWLGLGLVLFAVAVVFSVRGVDTMLRTRARLARLRFARPLLVFTLCAVALFAGSGFYIYYNTNVLNEYRSSEAGKKRQAQYEKDLKQYADLPQPRIVETRLHVDIYPYERDFTAEGYYMLKNKTPRPITDLHLQLAYQPEITTEITGITRLDSLGGGSYDIGQSWPDYQYAIYTLDRPLAPGDSLRLDWRVVFDTRGFVESGSNTDVVFNGTFFNNTYFPSLGYSEDFELTGDDDRKKQGLAPRERARPRTDSVGLHANLVGDDADNLRFGITMSTAADQIAIAPGYLQRSWEENSRRYFQYEMDVPMFNFYSMISARYAVRTEDWAAPWGKTVKLEIYHHPSHTYNLDRMMEAMKHSLTYYSTHFSPYQFRQMRIMEFPRYADFAQSFANTVPFSEGIGFILKIGEDDVDMAYYVTAHEMAHQWWGHQVTQAQVQGSAMISETMSQYSALMVMKEKYPPEQMQEFLRHELDRYLSGRATESKKEQPLVLVENQGYIHYRKGSLCMYALQDYIGEDSVNSALRRFVQDWAFREDIYPTTEDLMGYFRQVTPDSLRYLLVDLFETITLYELRTMAATYRPDGNGYLVDLDLNATKYRADSLGNETEIPLGDWIDVGVFGKTAADKDTLLYLHKHRIGSGQQRIAVRVPRVPVRAGIDPINKLIDRNPGDNVREVRAAE
ncbi:MAG: M1 family aminopeptidase [Bacteroidia bacterium]